MEGVDVMPTHRQVIDNTSQFFAVSVVLSFFVHVIFGGFAYFAPQIDLSRYETRKPALETRFINNMQVVDTFQEASDVKPKDAQYVSDRDLVAEEETSPEQQSTDLVSGAPNTAPSRAQEKREASQEPDVESFSLSQEELVALNDPLIQGRPDKVRGRLSDGYLKRLKKGDQLKVNALGLEWTDSILYE